MNNSVVSNPKHDTLRSLGEFMSKPRYLHTLGRKMLRSSMIGFQNLGLVELPLKDFAELEGRNIWSPWQSTRLQHHMLVGGCKSQQDSRARERRCHIVEALVLVFFRTVGSLFLGVDGLFVQPEVHLQSSD